MKKILLCFLMLFAFSIFLTGTQIKAEETNNIYTITEENHKMDIVLIDDENAKIIMYENEIELATLNMKYTLNEDVLTLYLGEEEFYVFKIESDGTLTEFEEEIIEPEFKSYVVVKNVKYGFLDVDIEEGNVGDVATIHYQAQIFCDLVEIRVNDVVILPDENGNYSFSLIEGENIVTGTFEVNEEDMELFASVLDDVSKGNWENIFTLENLFKLIELVFVFFFSSGFLIVLIKNKKVKAKTGDEIATAVSEVIPDVVKDVVKEKFGPLIEQLSNGMMNVEEIVKVMARCMSLAQENTPEARLAIVEELTKFKKSNEELAEEVRKVINQEIADNEKLKEARKKAISDLEEKNKKLLNKKEENNGRV